MEFCDFSCISQYFEVNIVNCWIVNYNNRTKQKGFAAAVHMRDLSELLGKKKQTILIRNFAIFHVEIECVLCRAFVLCDCGSADATQRYIFVLEMKNDNEER